MACRGGGRGQTVQVAATDRVVEIWSGADRIAVHPRATRSRRRLLAPGQWTGLPRPDRRPVPELARQRANVPVEVRPLAVYDDLLELAR